VTASRGTASALVTSPSRKASDLAILQRFAGVRVASTPTPIDRIERPDSHDILVKRDDLCGQGRGGAKARKVEHLVGHLLARGYDELITTASNVTNVVFDLLPVLRQRGLRSRLFILNDPHMLPRDREEIFDGVKDSVELLGPHRMPALRAMVAAYASSRRGGGRPFMALPGLSHPAAVVGSALGFVEMMSQRFDAGEPAPETVFVTAATGTTLAGLLLGEQALRQAGGPPVRIVGVQVYPGAVRQQTLRLLRWTERFLGLDARVPHERIEIGTTALHGGFGRYPEELSTLCERVAAEAGVLLDPIFGGKTWSVMETSLAGSRVSGSREAGSGEAGSRELRRPTLYWHCGYTPDWRTLGCAVRRGVESW
jgi:1-aminocyclopropane-1-carboxylate deaminase